MSGTLRLRKTWPPESNSALSLDPKSSPPDEVDPSLPPESDPSLQVSITLGNQLVTPTDRTPGPLEADDQIGTIRPSIQELGDGDDNGSTESSRRGTVLPTPLKQIKWTVILYIITFFLSVVLFFYIHSALVAKNSPLGPLLLDPSKTVLLFSALSQSYVLLLEFLLSSVFNNLRWQLASRDSGVLASTFLGLSRATSLWGVIMLMRRGTHILWGLNRLLLAALFLFVSVVLKVHLTFPYVFTPTSTVPVFAGLTPLNATFLAEGLVQPSVLAIYFSGWTASIIWVSKYTTGIEPVVCTHNCTSIFLPGGLEQARFLDTNLNKTLLEGGVFDGADAIIVHNAPGYHLEFYPIDPIESFNASTDCMLFGQSRGQGLYICVASKGYTLTAGWSVCPSFLFNNNKCFTNLTWTTQPLQQTTALSSFKRYDTVAYDRQNFSILSVEHITSPLPVAYNASDYQNVFSNLFTPVANDTPDNTVMVDAMLIQAGWLLRLYQDDFGDDQETPNNFLRDMLIIPIQFSTAAWQFSNATAQLVPGLFALPEDMVTTASAARVTPRVMATPWTVYVFIGLASVLYLCGASVLWYVLSQGPVPPNTSAFLEVDIMSKSAPPKNNRHGHSEEQAPSVFEDFSSALKLGGLGNAESNHIAKFLKGKIVKVRALETHTQGGRHVVLIMDDDSTVHDVELVESSSHREYLERLKSRTRYQ